ncbi:MAG: aldehyde dehydrogenase family protein, partial [Halobacteriales archaeon]
MGSVDDVTEDGEVRNYVAGSWERIDGEVGETVVDSATGDRIAAVPFSSVEAADEVVAAANEAFEEWRSRPVEERVQPLFRFKQLLEDHQEDVATVLVEEHGKTHDEAMGEIRRGIENVEVAAAIPRQMGAPHVQNAAPEIDETAVRRPLGTFAAITPFNFPGMIPLWFLPYSVAT